MAEISKIQIGEAAYDIKDAVAREALSGLSGAVHFIGETSTKLADGSTTAAVSIDGENVTAKSGDVVIYGELEFVFNGTKWSEFGSTGSLKALAFKDSATGDITPAGTNAPSAVTLEGGSTANLNTTTIVGTDGTEVLHDTPTLNRENVGSASGWDAGTMFTASVSGETLSLVAGVAPSLTITSTAVGTSLTAGAEKTVAKVASSATTVATGEVSASGAGAVVATALPTGGTAAAQVFAGTLATVTVD